MGYKKLLVVKSTSKLFRIGEYTTNQTSPTYSLDQYHDGEWRTIEEVRDSRHTALPVLVNRLETIYGQTPTWVYVYREYGAGFVEYGLWEYYGFPEDIEVVTDEVEELDEAS